MSRRKLSATLSDLRTERSRRDTERDLYGARIGWTDPTTGLRVYVDAESHDEVARVLDRITGGPVAGAIDVPYSLDDLPPVGHPRVGDAVADILRIGEIVAVWADEVERVRDIIGDETLEVEDAAGRPWKHN